MTDNTWESLSKEERNKIIYGDYIGVVEDFPKKGVSFKDISPLLADSVKFESVIMDMAGEVISLAEQRGLADDYNFINSIVGLDARGFIFGASLAFHLGAGFVMARKKGKLPGDVATVEYELEYGTETIELQMDKVKGKKVVIVDDVLATGGTLRATIDAVNASGGEVFAVITFIELTELKGRERLSDVEVISLVKY